MPIVPSWCKRNFPNATVNPCPFLSIKKATKFFHFLNCIWIALNVVFVFTWVFHISKKYSYRITNASTNNECQNTVLKYLNDNYFRSVDEEIEEYERFGTSLFHINSALKIRGLTLVLQSALSISFLIGTSFIISTFTQSERKNRSRALGIGIVYVLVTLLGIFLAIANALIFVVPVYSCVFAGLRFPLLAVTFFIVLPYKFLELAVTVQYLRILGIFIFDPETRKTANITADEPGWFIAWLKNRNLPQDYKLKIEAQKQADKTLHQEKLKRKLEKDEDEYRRRNRGQVKRNEIGERINWMERVGKFRGGIPDPAIVGDDGSGIYTIETSGSWGTNLTRSMSRSSPDSELSVDDYMNNYEDYYDLMIRQRGGSPSENPSVTSQRPSIFTFKTMNKVSPEKGNKTGKGLHIPSSDSIVTISAKTTIVNEVSNYSASSAASSVNLGKVNKKVKILLPEDDPSLMSVMATRTKETETTHYSATTTTVSNIQDDANPGKTKGKIKSSKKEQKITSTMDDTMIQDQTYQQPLNDEFQSNTDQDKSKKEKSKKSKSKKEKNKNKGEVETSDSELDIERQRPKIVKGKEPKVMKK